MILQKIFILFLLVLLSQFKPDELKSSGNSYHLSDSLNQVILQGFDNENISFYYHYLLNSNINFLKERRFLQNFPYSVYITFSRSILLKREMKYHEMYDSLYTYLNEFPEFYSYYDELVFAATASDKLNELKNRIKKIKKFPQDIFSKYLEYSINSSEGFYNEALENLNSVIEKDSTSPELYYNLSYIYRNIGNYDKALSVLNNSKIKFQKNEYYISKTFNPIGSLYFLSDDYETAEKFYKEGLTAARKWGDKINEAKSLINLAIISDINGNIENARTLFENAFEIADKINDIETSALALSELGVSYTFTNNIIEAKNNYLKSYSLYKKTGNKNRLSLLSNNIGKIYLQLFDFKSAIKIFNEGLELASESKRGKILNLIGLADAYSNLSNYTKALKYYKDAEELSAEINEISLNAEVKTSLGTLNYNLNHFGNSLKLFSSAEELISKTGDPYLSADIYFKLGSAYSKADSLVKAEEYLSKSEKISIENSDFVTASLSTNMMADTYIDKGKLEEAEIILKRSEQYVKKSGWNYLEALTRILKGKIIYKKGDFSEAADNFKKSFMISQELNQFDLQIEAYFLLAKMHEENNMNEAAESYYNSALTILEDVSRPLFGENDVQISYLSGKAEIYNSFAQFYLNQNEYEKAFRLIDKFRSRNMIANLVNLKLQSLIKDEKLIDKVYEYEWMIHSGIYSVEETDSLKNRLILLKNELVKENPALKKYLNFKRNFSIKEIQNNLDKDENIISIYPAKEKTYIFLINKDSFKYFISALTSEELQDLISSVSSYFSFTAGEDKPFYNQDLFSFNAESSFKLYSALFKNVLKDIPGNQKIILIPSTELLSFPFEFLITSYSDNQSPYTYSDKNYLIFDYNISYTPSASAYIEQKQNMLKNNNKVLIVGDPAINSNSRDFAERRGLLEESAGIPRNIALLPLKYSGEEVDGISSLINADRVLISSDATETNFKNYAELSKIIHISSHSFLYNMQPLIFFSNLRDKENDGFLEAGEIVQLQLNSDIVVLSSCNSGLGAVDEAEGILGMTKAFFEAGAKSIVVSLWDVNDKYTSKFMTLFYKNLSEGYNKSEALRYAKIEFIKEYSANPYYWGAFVLTGNINPVDIKEDVNINPYLLGVLSVVVLSSIIITIHKKNRSKKSNSLS